MCVWYLKEKKVWRYQFMFRRERYSRSCFATKEEAIDAEIEHRQLLKGTNFKKPVNGKPFFRKALSINITDTGCFICTSRYGRRGYPQVTVDKKSYHLHRFIYALMNGPIPPGMIIMHTCDNPFCINPGHHKLGTHSENAIDKVQKGRHRGGPNWVKKNKFSSRVSR